MKNIFKKIQQKIYAIFQSLKAHTSKLRISSFVGGQFKKRQERKKNKTMGKFNDYGLIGVLSAMGLGFLVRYYHKPLRTIKFYRYKLLNKNIISDKIIEIELIKKDKSNINRQVRIDVIKFCFRGFDRNDKEFVDNHLIERIDDNDLVFEKNDDKGLYKVRIPFEFSLKYFDAKEIKLTVSYKTPLNDDFVVHDRIIDLTEITDNFKLLVDRQKELINYQSLTTIEEKFKIFNQGQPIRKIDEEHELNDDQFTLDDNENWVNWKGETPEEYDKRKANGE
jgi:hypothetical protein